MQHSDCGGFREAPFSPSGMVAGRWKTHRLSWDRETPDLAGYPFVWQSLGPQRIGLEYRYLLMTCLARGVPPLQGCENQDKDGSDAAERHASHKPLL